MRPDNLKHRAARTAFGLLAAVAPFAAGAQESSVNAYSPYSLYGVGTLAGGSGVGSAAMGGVEIGYRNAGFDTQLDVRVGVANPASLSGLPPRNFIFDVGMHGSNIYLRENNAAFGRQRSSFNTFNINNISATFPIAKRFGAAIHLVPFSQVGYRIHKDDKSNLADLGMVRYLYMGEGDITEAKLSFGWEPFKNFSIGAEMIYMWGNIDRTYQAIIWDYTGTGQYGEISSRNGALANTNEKISRVFGAFGLQYTPLNRTKTRLTIGATYRMGGKLRSHTLDAIPSNNIYQDMVRQVPGISSFRMPQRVGVGIFLHRPKWALGLDYIWADWGRNGLDAVNGVRYVDTHTIKLGGQFTPNRYDIRGKGSSFFNRITYKAGVRVGNDYLNVGGTRISERAVTFGIDIPFSAMTVSRASIGVELGERGTLKNHLVRERYFKVTVGVMLFGKDYDYWFEKYKYN